MDKRTGSALIGSGGSRGDDGEANAIRNDIEQTRADMSRTVNAIEERLSPAHLKEQVLEQYQDAKAAVKDDILRELQHAKTKVQDEIQEAKMAVRDATVGRVEHMVHDARETVSEAGSSIIDTIKRNPIPTAMIALGAGWLLMNGRRSSGRRISIRSDRERRNRFGGYSSAAGFELGDRYGGFDRDRYGAFDRGMGGIGEEREDPSTSGRRGEGGILRHGADALHGIGEGASNVAQRVQEGASHLVDETGARVRDAQHAVGEMAHAAEETASRVAHQARERVGYLAHDLEDRAERAYRGAAMQVRRAEAGIEVTMQENPLAVAAVALAVGAAIGLALPHTEAEDEWMGDVKDRFIRRAEGVAGEAIDKVEGVAQQALQGAGGRQGQEQGREGRESSPGAQLNDKRNGKAPDRSPQPG